MEFLSCLDLSDDDLARRDIADVNMLVAKGLKGTSDLHPVEQERKLDRLTDVVDQATRRLLPRFRPSADEYEGTPGRFRMLVLVTVLQRDFGLRYNRAFSEGNYDARDARNLFIFGPLGGHGGTCVTMPVLYTAIGRRLGYPLKLVQVKGHAFCRWDGDERFNIEATSLGFNPRPDDFYLTSPFPISAREMARGFYLKSMTPRQELAFFLQQRCCCCMDNFSSLAALEAACVSSKLWPENNDYARKWGVAIIFHRAVERIRDGRFVGTTNLLRMPNPVETWEHQLYPFVHSEVNRILANHHGSIAVKN